MSVRLHGLEHLVRVLRKRVSETRKHDDEMKHEYGIPQARRLVLRAD